MRRTYN